MTRNQKCSNHSNGKQPAGLPNGDWPVGGQVWCGISPGWWWAMVGLAATGMVRGVWWISFIEKWKLVGIINKAPIPIILTTYI